MKYYKLLTDDSFIGVVNSNDFVRENPNNGWLLTSNEILGQFVDFENKLYRDFWMQPIPHTLYNYTQVRIIEITEEEYDTLKKAIDNDEPVIIDNDDDDEPIIVPVEEDDPDYALEFARESKIHEMSAECRRTIEAGIDITIQGEVHHFSLTTQDQLNLMGLSAAAKTQTLIPYHADGEEFVFYSSEDANLIIEETTAFKTYQTAYFNSLKNYIGTLQTLEEIAAIEYGIPIPEEYKSNVLKILEA